MAPTKSTKDLNKGKSNISGSAKKSAKLPGTAPAGISKRKVRNQTLAKPGGAQKTKPKSTDAGKKKKRVYNETELDIPKLNGIIPAGIAKPKGQKKGKKFVDDPESMIAIMSVVNAEKEGHIESKIMRARQLEEIREAKRKEQEKKAEYRKSKFEETKESLRKKRKNRHSDPMRFENIENEEPKNTNGKRKRVSFG
ncbi:hypothetical protein CC78DRAFT_529543 [Lojkania enalia]|uniref:60S ribosomal subunit assembly/export protein LOC1 n=1 Tax=Lojkania enalia TaxID=147567 RepID=A0A9P4KIC0_9PLEO|nr:hypothetical protein CC78DRAFT_529543 [Didymosphaeria enalia]